MIAHSGCCLEEIARYVGPAAVGRHKGCVLSPRRAARFFKIIKSVSGFSQDDLVGKGRSRGLVHARWIFILACQRLSLSEVSFSEIGRHLDKDHTTIMHGARMVQAYLRVPCSRSIEVQRLWRGYQGQWRDGSHV